MYLEHRDSSSGEGLLSLFNKVDMVKRILITHHYPIDAPGGGTRSCLKIAQHLELLGVEVILVSIGAKPGSRVPNTNVSVIPVAKHKFHYLLAGISIARVVRKIINEEKPIDAVISWEYEGAFLPNMLKNRKIPFCMIAAKPSYSDWVNRKTSNYMKSLSDSWFRWRLFREADVVFVSSDFACKEIVNLFSVQPERVKKIYRGVDKEFSRTNISSIKEVKNLIFYGSFAPNKGVFDAISAMAKVVAYGKTNWQMKLAGWGYEDEIKEEIRSRGLENQVILLGKLDTKELIKELEWAHLAILPSRAESFGRAIAEAQAAGIAVVSYDSGSIPELIEDGITGWVVPAGRVDLLADAIEEAIQHPKRVSQMGIEGRKHVIQKFTWEETAKLILEGIQEAKLKINSFK